jgi:hypothetical protein
MSPRLSPDRCGPPSRRRHRGDVRSGARTAPVHSSARRAPRPRPAPVSRSGRIERARTTAPAGLARLASPPPRPDLGFGGDLMDPSRPEAPSRARRRPPPAEVIHLEFPSARRILAAAAIRAPLPQRPRCETDSEPTDAFTRCLIMGASQSSRTLELYNSRALQLSESRGDGQRG